MSWESSAEYYRLLNLGVEERLGGLHSAKTVMHSVEFAELTTLQREERWDEVAAILPAAAVGVQSAGADVVLLCTTTFHRVADQVAEAVDVPVLHLADVVADAVSAAELKKVALLGTAFTMGRRFFSDRLESHGLSVVTPPRSTTRRSTGSSTTSWSTAGCSTRRAAPSSTSSTSCGTRAPRV